MSAPPAALACVAIVSKTVCSSGAVVVGALGVAPTYRSIQNAPLFLKCFGDADPLKLQFIAHSSLDIVVERRACGLRGDALIC